MKVTEFTRRELENRRDEREMTEAGFTKTVDFDWRLTRGGLYRHRIAEVKISADGKAVWYRTEPDVEN